MLLIFFERAIRIIAELLAKLVFCCSLLLVCGCSQETKTYVYERLPSEDLSLDVYESKVSGTHCVLYIHGGALLTGGRKDMDRRLSKMLNEHGIDVVSIDYRLAPAASIQEIVADVEHAVLFTRSLFPKKALVAMGHSAGGYLSLMSGTFQHPPDGIVSLAGYGDLLGEWYTTSSDYYVRLKNVQYVEEKLALKKQFLSFEEKADLYIFLRQRGLWPHFVLGDLNHAEVREKFCPVYEVSQNYPPTFLLHCNKDEDVPYIESMKFADVLKQKGISFRLSILPNCSHQSFWELQEKEIHDQWMDIIDFIKSIERRKQNV